MRDDDELRLFRDAAHVVRHADHIGFIERRLDLIHDAKRRRMHLQNGKVQRDGDERLLAAGEQRDRLERLAGRLHLDLNAAGKHIVLILQLQRRLAAAEKLKEGLLEALADEGELFFEDARHFAGDALDDAEQLFFRFFHVVALCGEIGVARVHAVKLLDRADIDAAETADLALELGNAAVRLGYALKLDALLLRRRVGKLIIVPKLVEDLLLLHRGGGFLLLQLARRVRQLEHGVVQLAKIAVALILLRFKRKLALDQLRDLPALFLRPDPQRIRRGRMFGDPAAGLLVGGPVLSDQRLTALLVPAHLLAQAFKAAQRLLRCLALRRVTGKPALIFGDLITETGRGLQQLALTGELFLRQRFECSRLLLLPGNERFLFADRPERLASAALDRFKLLLHVLQTSAQGGEQNIVVVFLARELQHSFVCRTLLRLGDLQLVLRLGQLTLRFLRVAEGKVKLFLQTAALGGKLLELVGAAEDAGAARYAAARHGAAAVDDLSVERDDAEAVLILSRHRNAAVQIVRHDRAPEKAEENILVLFVEPDKLARNADEAILPVKSLFVQRLAADGGKRQKGRTPTVALLEEADGAFGVLLAVDDDILHAGAECDLDRDGIAPIDRHQACNGTVYAAKRLLSGGLHDEFDRLVEPVVLLFHLAQHVDAGVEVVHLHGKRNAPFLRALFALHASLHLHGVTADDVVDRVGVLLRCVKRFTVFRCAPFRLGKLRFHTRLFLGKGGFPLVHLADGGAQRRGLRAAVRRRGKRQRLLCAQAFDLIRRLARAFGKLARCFKKTGKLLLYARSLLRQLLDARRLLVDLLRQAAGAVRLVAHLLLDAGDRIVVVLDARAQHGDLGFLLAHLCVQRRGFGAQRLLCHIVFADLFTVLLR